ncbi:hypothetical protein BFC17_04665 [Alteromonas lipolytica]|uniref:histidine kinase n=1 Tax=Alteromonas lipolytica TaxID=1856405 RepID=A0A1E8FDK3_9ALTE|nr:hypothetical protein BFC17_04665 [Alteromonas lipolytica]
MQIPARWRYLSVLFIVFVCVLVGHFTYQQHYNDLKRPLEIKQNALTDQTALRINARLSLVDTQIRLFRHELTLLNPEQSELEQVMFSMFRIYSDLLQARWIDLTGKEQVRVDRTPDNEVIKVATEMLQNKSRRYYFTAGMALSWEQVFISQIDLNVENGQVQRPLQPTLRAVIKASLPSMGEGLLVINFDLRSLLSQLQALNQADNELLIGAGDYRWIVHPEPGKTWHADLAEKRADIVTDLPEIAAKIKAGNLVQGDELNNQLFTVQTLLTTANSEGGLQDIHIIARTPAELLPAVKRQAIVFASIITFVTALGGLSILYAYWRHLTQLNKLSQSVQNERNNLQQALQRQSTLIEELAEAKKLSSLSVMVAGLAHELNTPVGATQLALSNQERLLEKLITQKQTGLTKTAFESFLSDSQQSLEQAQHNNRRAVELIQGFKRLTFERANDELNTFNVGQHLNDLCHSMKGLLKRSNVRLESDIPADITLTGYAGAFTQIVQICISNAIEHAFKGMSGACITIKSKAQNDRILVTIADNGVGIARDVMPFIFDPFYTSQRNNQHTGLGLHMAKVWLEEAFNGTISVDSTLGKGTVFTLSFNQLDQLAADIRKAGSTN